MCNNEQIEDPAEKIAKIIEANLARQRMWRIINGKPKHSRFTHRKRRLFRSRHRR